MKLNADEKSFFSFDAIKATALWIALIAFIVRLLFIWFYANHSLAGGDQAAFWSFAEGIFTGQGFRSALEPWLADRPPLYSYFLALIFLLGGKNLIMVFVIQAFVWGIAAYFFYILASKVLDKSGSLIAGLIFALFPHFLLFTKQILTETIYIPIWVFLLTSLIFLKNRPTSKVFLSGAGIFLGLLILVRREAIFPGVFIIVALSGILFQSRWIKIIETVLIISLIAGLVISPWVIRNYFVLGEPIISSSGGYNFMVGNNPLADGAYSPPPANWQAQFEGISELERDQLAWDLSLQWIQNNPAKFTDLLPVKLSILWGPARNLVLDVSDIVLMLLCIFGLIRVFQRKEYWAEISTLSLIPILTTTLIGLIFVGAWRYRLIVYPGLILLAGYGSKQIRTWYFSLVDHFRQRQDNAATI